MSPGTASATALTPPAPAAGRPQPGPPPPVPFTPRLAFGLLGVLTAVLVSGFNEHVTEIDLPDLRGVLGIGHDEGTWLTALYEAFQVSAMAFAPWCAMTFSLRRFTIAMVALFAVLAALAPFMPNLPSLYVLRAVQGLAGGALPPMLMTVALRYLPPRIKVYGLGAYALTATFGPNLGTPLAAFSYEYLGWQWVYWEAIPFYLISVALVAWGMPQDPMRLERFKLFDWRGLLLGFPAISLLVIGLMQGDRLDWFRSPFICHAFIGGSFLLLLFLVNEWFHPMPFFRIQMLRSANLSFALIGVSVVLMLAVANGEIFSAYLSEVRGYRPLQITPLALVIAVPQLAGLLLASALCNIRAVDCRWVLAIGILMMGGSAYGQSFITSDWYRGSFYLLQLLQAFGQPLAVVPILMLAVFKLGPADGPFVSGIFNMTKGFANAIAAGTISFLQTWREHTHSNILLDHFGGVRFTLQALGEPRQSLQDFAEAVRTQAIVLSAADINLVMMGIALSLLPFLLLMPARVYAPSSAAPMPAAPMPAAPIPSGQLPSGPMLAAPSAAR